ncbi:MAG: ATP-binding protein [Litorilinea sp.]
MSVETKSAPRATSLAPDALYTKCTLPQMDFATTADLQAANANDAVDYVGHERAVQAIEMGVSIERQGYNIYAMGPVGAGKRALVTRFIEARAANEPPPDDWVYVNNFKQPNAPLALRLPAGQGRQLQQDMAQLVEDMRTALSSAFESDEYQTRRQALTEEYQERQQENLRVLQEEARTRGLALLRTPSGLAFAPLQNGEVLPPEEFQKLPEEEQKRVQAEVEGLQSKLQTVLMEVPKWERELTRRMRALNQEVAGFVLDDLLDDLYTKYEALPQVVEYLHAVRKDVGENLEGFIESSGEDKSNQPPANLPIPEAMRPGNHLRRYTVNLLVDSADAKGAPVIHESNPSYLNLVGRVEQMAMMGALITDFTLIKPGALHRANGGYLILDAAKVLTNPYAWEGLKRALQFDEVRIESPGQMMNMTTTVTIEAEPVELDVKVVLMGDRMIYYMLAQADPDFQQLFKIAADFDDKIDRNEANSVQYARLIANIIHKEELRPFAKDAVCRVIEHAARLVSDSERLTAQVQTIVDLLEEADHWAGRAATNKNGKTKGKANGDAIVEREHVQAALDARAYRSGRVREGMQEDILRATIHVATEGTVVGQINGLSVLQMGNYAFGRPARITANVYLGRGEVINIEREVALSGPLHSKGVMILAAFLRGRYTSRHPLSLGAALVFEQSYGGIDGDSASSTELYALLSAIAQVPIRQSLAVTGSVDQYGNVQAIGGVNEKIEGFFDLCRARELSGDQGVVIPASNVKHLMLRQDVVDAVAAGEFHVYPVETIDQGIEILTGVAAGERDADGDYPAGTLNRLVADRLEEFAKQRQAFAQDVEHEDAANS